MRRRLDDGGGAILRDRKDEELAPKTLRLKRSQTDVHTWFEAGVDVPPVLEADERVEPAVRRALGESGGEAGRACKRC